MLLSLCIVFPTIWREDYNSVLLPIGLTHRLILIEQVGVLHSLCYVTNKVLHKLHLVLIAKTQLRFPLRKLLCKPKYQVACVHILFGTLHLFAVGGKLFLIGHIELQICILGEEVVHISVYFFCITIRHKFCVPELFQERNLAEYISTVGHNNYFLGSQYIHYQVVGFIEETWPKGGKQNTILPYWDILHLRLA